MGAVGQCSYNQLVEKIIEQKSSSEASKITEGLRISKKKIIEWKSSSEASKITEKLGISKKKISLTGRMIPKFVK